MTYDVPVENLSSDVHDRHKAIDSLREELNAIDFYDQRLSVIKDVEYLIKSLQITIKFRYIYSSYFKGSFIINK